MCMWMQEDWEHQLIIRRLSWRGIIPCQSPPVLGTQLTRDFLTFLMVAFLLLPPLILLLSLIPLCLLPFVHQTTHMPQNTTSLETTLNMVPRVSPLLLPLLQHISFISYFSTLFSFYYFKLWHLVKYLNSGITNNNSTFSINNLANYNTLNFTILPSSSVYLNKIILWWNIKFDQH